MRKKRETRWKLNEIWQNFIINIWQEYVWSLHFLSGTYHPLRKHNFWPKNCALPKLIAIFFALNSNNADVSSISNLILLEYHPNTFICDILIAFIFDHCCFCTSLVGCCCCFFVCLNLLSIYLTFVHQLQLCFACLKII